MGKFQQIFLRTGERIINVDYVDFVTGKGFVKFYLGNLSGENRISQQTFYSSLIYIQGSKYTHSGAVSTEQIMDIDFDLDFKRTIIIEGEAIFSIPLAWDTDTSVALELYMIVKVRKWNGTTETEIANTQSATITETTTASTPQITMYGVTVDVPRTVYRDGDSLRVTIEVWSRGMTDAGSQQALLPCDPMGRTVNTLVNYEEWNVGTAGRDVTFASPSQGSANTIATALIPIKTS